MKLGIIKKAVVAVTVATAASAGMTGAAFASKNTHKYQTSGEAQRQQFVDPCDGIWGQFANDVKQAGIADKNGQTGARDNWLVLADAALEAGQKAGCGWAARTTVPTPSTTVVPTVKTVGSGRVSALQQ